MVTHLSQTAFADRLAFVCGANNLRPKSRPIFGTSEFLAGRPFWTARQEEFPGSFCALYSGRACEKAGVLNEIR